jgi:hypothetical protein
MHERLKCLFPISTEKESADEQGRKEKKITKGEIDPQQKRYEQVAGGFYNLSRNRHVALIQTF